MTTYTHAETLRMQSPSAHEQRAFAGMPIAVIDDYERAVGPARERYIAAQIARVPLWNAYISRQSNLPVPAEIDAEAEAAELELYRISADAWLLAVAAGAETATAETATTTTTTTTVRFPVEAEYLTAVPCYESHKRGKNWAATLTIDPSSPGGLGRNFLARGRGEYFYNVQNLTPGTPVEFGGDYYTGSGGKRSHRFYGIVTEVTAEYVEFAQYATGKAAIKAADAFRAERAVADLEQAHEGTLDDSVPTSDLLPPASPDLMASLSDADLLAELARRGYTAPRKARSAASAGAPSSATQIALF